MQCDVTIKRTYVQFGTNLLYEMGSSVLNRYINWRTIVVYNEASILIA